MLEQDKRPNDYQWLEMSFYTRWTENTSVLICFDTPENFPTDFLATLQARHGGGSSFLQPYVLHVILMHLLVPIYDKSIWDLSKRVRKFEEKRDCITETGFPGLHDVARHTAHATETVQVGSNVLERMISECEALATRQADDQDQEAMYGSFEALKLQHSMMLGIAARSTSNEKRLSNEINLVFNMMAQKDNGVNLTISQANMEIARATRADSVAMKTIAIVTLTFLPATYVSALLGMNLFNFDPNAHGGHITYSPDLWIYFLSSILLSIVVLAIWWVWQRREDMVEDARDTGSKTPSPAP